MPGVEPHGVPVAGHALLELLQSQILVARQGVGVGEGGIQLQRPLEELQGCILVLQKEPDGNSENVVIIGNK